MRNVESHSKQMNGIDLFPIRLFVPFFFRLFFFFYFQRTETLPKVSTFRLQRTLDDVVRCANCWPFSGLLLTFFFHSGSVEEEESRSIKDIIHYFFLFIVRSFCCCRQFRPYLCGCFLFIYVDMIFISFLEHIPI